MTGVQTCALPIFDLPPPSIESSAYIPDSLVPAHYARSVFTGGPKDFDANMIARLTVKPESVTWSQNEVWEHFASVVSPGERSELTG